MKFIKYVILCGLIASQCFAEVIEFPITLRVVDEAGNPVQSAETQLFFQQNRMLSPAIQLEGLTDKSGVYSTVQSGDGGVDIYVKAPGYYDWYKKFDFYPSGVTGEMVPFDPEKQPIEVVLKSIDHPVPMFVKEMRIEIPILDAPVGFDMEKADWCKPHGSGINADFFMQVHKDFKDRWEFEGSLKVTFSNKGNGILYLKTRDDYGNDLRVPKIAPVTGYSSAYNKTIIYSSSKKVLEGIEPDKEGNFIFRVRSEVDENDQIVSANYGKIYGGFTTQLRGTETAKIRFRYYFNSDDTSRNLEFDPQQNLFPGKNRYAP